MNAGYLNINRIYKPVTETSNQNNKVNFTANYAKFFHIGDVLSITTDRLVSPRHMDGVHDIVNHMLGETFEVHYKEAFETCRKALFKKYPELKSVNAANLNETNWRIWLLEQTKKYGKTFEVEPVEIIVREDPVAAVERIVGADKIFHPEFTSNGKLDVETTAHNLERQLKISQNKELCEKYL